MEQLTHKQKRFCEEYIIDLNATQAAIRAGYSEKTANEQGSQLLAKLSIHEYVANLQKERSDRTQITADMVIKELAKVGFSNISDYLKVFDREIEAGVDEKGDPIKATVRDVEIFITDNVGKDKMAVVSEVKQTRDGISIKLHDKVKALEDLGKHLGVFEKDNKQKKPDALPPDVLAHIVNKINQNAAS
jgi:phage terminase small subunit